MKAGLLSIGYENFECEVAGKRLRETEQQMSRNGYQPLTVSYVLTKKEEIQKAVEKLKKEGAGCLILQCGTFCGGEEILCLAKEICQLPVILWGFPEPEAGTFEKIAVNSMTGFLMASSVFGKLGIRFEALFGNVPEALPYLLIHLKALSVMEKLGQSRFMCVGGKAPGFYFSAVDELKFQRTFGTEICEMPVEELIRRCGLWTEKETGPAVEKIKKRWGSINLGRQELEKTARMYLTFVRLKEEAGVDAFAVRCWPEMQTLYEFAPCAVLGMLGDEGILCSCEGDIPGLMAMYIGYLLSGDRVFFADLVNRNESGSLKFWHCGCAPVSLAKDKKQTRLECQPTLAQPVGAASSFELRQGDAVVCQLKETKEGYLFWSAAAEAVSADRKTSGNQSDLMLRAPWEDVFHSLISDGIGQHFAIVYQDITKELEILFRRLCVDFKCM